MIGQSMSDYPPLLRGKIELDGVQLPPVIQKSRSGEMDLQNKSLEELKDLKKRWYAEAKDNGDITACHLVGRVLGTLLSAPYGPKYKFIKDDISIYVDDYGHFITVRFENKQVCSTHPCDLLFIPGKWMEKVRTWAANEAHQQAEQEKSTADKKERWRLISELSLDKKMESVAAK